MNYHLFDNPDAVVTALAEQFQSLSKRGVPVHISLSGGSTPRLLFAALGKPPFQQAINWHNLHFWWGDERCVDPSDPESNFGDADRLLFQHITIPAENIHRILGEIEPAQEAQRFADEMQATVPVKQGLPAFDWILLGMGEDGHTASLFPHQTDLADPHLAIVASHPDSGQLRVTKTARLIANADRVTYLVLGDAKASILQEIQQNTPDSLPYPAAKIQSHTGQTEWYLDSQAAQLLD